MRKFTILWALVFSLTVHGSGGSIGGGGSGGTWGSITGTLSSQSDLNTALGLKAPAASPTFTGTVTTPSGSVTSSAWDTGTSTLTANGLRLDPTITNDGNSSTAITVDFSHVPVHKVTMTGNATFTLTAPATGTVCVLQLAEDGTGSRVPTWPAAVKWPAGSAPSLSGANKTDIITLLWDGTSYYGNSALNF